MQKQTYNAKDLAALLQISESKSYQIIRQMNAELESRGFLVVRGRVPINYVRERFFGMNEDRGNNVNVS